MTDIPITPVWEEPPAGGRGGGARAIEWENLLAPFREHPNQPGRLFVFQTEGDKPAANQARGRASSMQRRLTDKVPSENWAIQARPMNADKSTFGVWVTYKGTFSPQQVADRASKLAARRQAREQRKQAEQAAANAAVNTPPTAAELAMDQTASADGPDVAVAAPDAASAPVATAVAPEAAPTAAKAAAAKAAAKAAAAKR